MISQPILLGCDLNAEGKEIPELSQRRFIGELMGALP